MNTNKSGELLRSLRLAKGMTQKQVADILGVVPKTVSKWETGNGFPDVSVLSALADILGTSERALLSGEIMQNYEQCGNMKNVKFYVCPQCMGFVQSVGESTVNCCAKILPPLELSAADGEHSANITDDGSEICVRFDHPQTKEHYILFAAYVSYDRVLTVRMYPEQEPVIRFAKTHGGRLYYYCSRHGLFFCDGEKTKKTAGSAESIGSTGEKNGVGMTARMSAFARAYHFQTDSNPVFADSYVRRLLTDDEYENIQKYIELGGKNVREYVNTNLAPTPLARARYCEESLGTAIATGTRQYVILGCGYDTYPLRSDGSVEIFEIDKPEIIADKIRRIRAAGLDIGKNVHMIGADLAAADIGALLADNGFDKSKKTFFSCLGLLYYLSDGEVRALFSRISDFAAKGSSVVFDFADGGLFSSTCARVSEMVKMAHLSGEDMKSCYGYSELEKMLEDCGFLIYEYLNTQDIQNRFFGGRDDISAFENVNYALAVI